MHISADLYQMDPREDKPETDEIDYLQGMKWGEWSGRDIRGSDTS